MRLRPGVGLEVDRPYLGRRGRFGVRGIDAAVLRVRTHGAGRAQGPHREQVGLADLHGPALLDGTGRTASGRALRLQVGTAVGTAFVDNLEVVLRQFLSVAGKPVGKAVVERGVRYEVAAGNHVDTVACRNFVAELMYAEYETND